MRFKFGTNYRVMDPIFFHLRSKCSAIRRHPKLGKPVRIFTLL